MKKIIATLLTLAMLLSLAIVATTNVSAQSEPWDGINYSETFSSGSGTEEDPYIIMNGNDLYKLAVDASMNNLYAGTFFKLGDDINLGGNIWTPIGLSSTNPFSGNVDGNGKTVYNFSVLNHPAGLFGIIADNVVKNLKIDHAVIQNNSNNIAGALAGKTMRATVENIEIGENVLVGNIPMGKKPQTGGLIGLCTDHSTVKNVIFRGQVEVTIGEGNNWIGGIIGVFGGDSVLDGAINYGKLVYANEEGLETDVVSVAGIVGGTGNMDLTGTIKNCINYGAIESSSYASGIIGRTGMTDGLVVENCFNVSTDIKARQTADGALQAGLILAYGAFSGTFTNCASVTVENIPTCGFVTDGVTLGEPDGMRSAASVDELTFDPAFGAILESVPAAMPTWNEVTPEEAPEVTETEGTDPEVTEPEGTNPIEDTKPEETDPATPVETDPVQTPSTDAPGTEKPAEGGCGSVVAGGLAILAVVALAGVALKKRN